MAKLKFDVRGVETQKDVDYDTPVPRGVYECTVDEIEGPTPSKSSGNPQLTVTYRISEGEWADRLLWDYVGLDENQEWKYRMLLEALALVKDGKETGEFDTTKVVGTRVLIRVKHQTDAEYGTRAKVGAALPHPDGPGKGKKAAKSSDLKPKDEPEPDEEKQDEPESDDDDELTYEDLASYDRDDLEAVIEENDLTDEISFNKRTKDDALREKIAEALELEPEDEDEESSDDDEDEQDYSEMDLKALKAEASERGLATGGTKKSLIKRLEKDDAEADGGGDPF